MRELPRTAVVKLAFDRISENRRGKFDEEEMASHSQARLSTLRTACNVRACRTLSALDLKSFLLASIRVVSGLIR